MDRGDTYEGRMITELRGELDKARAEIKIWKTNEAAVLKQNREFREEIEKLRAFVRAYDDYGRNPRMEMPLIQARAALGEV